MGNGHLYGHDKFYTVVMGGSEMLNPSLPTVDELRRELARSPKGERSRARFPSLDRYVSSRPSIPWDKSQKRTYGQFLSWLRVLKTRGYQFLWVMLSTANAEKREDLNRDLKRLVKRIYRLYGYDVHHFGVETSEGFGVYHFVWAIKSDTPVWIGQKWLSRVWKVIHGANVVWIERIGSSRRDQKNVASYCVSQYMSGQSLYVRRLWSWWKFPISLTKCWEKVKKHYRLQVESLNFGWRLTSAVLKYQDLISAWEHLLDFGWCVLGDVTFMLTGRVVKTMEEVHAW